MTLVAECPNCGRPISTPSEGGWAKALLAAKTRVAVTCRACGALVVVGPNPPLVDASFP